MEKQRRRNQSEVLGELNKYEEILANFLWVIMLFLILIDIYTSYIIGQAAFRKNVFIIQAFIFAAVIAIGIYRMLRKEQISRNWLYAIMKIIDILLIVVLVNTMRHGFLFYFLVLLPIVSVCIVKGFSSSLYYLGFGAIIHLAARYFSLKFEVFAKSDTVYHGSIIGFLMVVVLYLVYALFLRILGNFNNQFSQSERDNQNLVIQLGRKYAQLEEARLEKQEQFDKLKEVNLQLEESNKRLTSSLAEFFTLQQISQAISSIFDMNELLQFVNDIIIGVMGVSTSNIALYGGTGDRLKVQVSNISDKRALAILTDNINTPILKDAIDEGQSIINNTVNSDEYAFTAGRNVRSLLCVPLQVKGKAHGLVLIEHSIPDAFDSDNVRLLEIITQQVSIAIENARLYEQLQEYANTDGLTQVYNRLFFQNRLQEELKQAQEQGYEVSVILYDIDNFKSFNDSYGHLFGDIVLKSLAQTVKESIRKDDIVARFGGEEFIILLSHTGKERAFEKAEELRKKISSLTVCDKVYSASVTVSMGVSTYPTLAKTETLLIGTADDALYVAKRSGKNCVKMAGDN